MEPLDFAHHRSSLNGHQAVVDSDGVFRALISAKDPGIANWLDVTGHAEGAMLIRWLSCDTGPLPATKLVRVGEVATSLPESTSKLMPDERAKLLERRYDDVAGRYRSWRRCSLAFMLA